MHNVRKVPYLVKRVTKNGETHYRVLIGNDNHRISRKGKAEWYAKGRYHKSLRDAVIYCAYGL